MLIIRILIGLLLLPFGAFAYQVIFVHLGKNIPECLLPVMKQARYFNPDCDIFLLVDELAEEVLQREQSRFFAEEKIVLVSVPHSEEHRSFLEKNRIDPNLANGMWKYATERFFTLLDFMREKQLEDVIHLESDTMLYIDLAELMPKLNALDCRLAAPFQSLVGCIPSFVFIRDYQSLSLLVEHMLTEVVEYPGKFPHVYVNDMQTLASFYRKWGEPYLVPLPTLMAEYGRYFTKRKSRFSPDNETPLSFLSLHASSFSGWLFDAAGLGIWINGNDPRYSPSHRPGTVHSRCLFDPRYFSFDWGEDEKGRAVPYLSFKGNEYRILNLHFHSKKVEEFTSYGERRDSLARF